MVVRCPRCDAPHVPLRRSGCLAHRDPRSAVDRILQIPGGSGYALCTGCRRVVLVADLGIMSRGCSEVLPSLGRPSITDCVRAATERYPPFDSAGDRMLLRLFIWRSHGGHESRHAALRAQVGDDLLHDLARRSEPEWRFVCGDLCRQMGLFEEGRAAFAQFGVPEGPVDWYVQQELDLIERRDTSSAPLCNPPQPRRRPPPYDRYGFLALGAPAQCAVVRRAVSFPDRLFKLVAAQSLDSHILKMVPQPFAGAVLFSDAFLDIGSASFPSDRIPCLVIGPAESARLLASKLRRDGVRARSVTIAGIADPAGPLRGWITACKLRLELGRDPTLLRSGRS